MATNRSEKSRFQSRYADNTWISPAQFITECLCVLIARQQKKELNDRFWKEPYWAKIFRSQTPTANQLLKKHPPEVILMALRDRRCWKIQSFRAKWLLNPILAEKQREYDAKEALSQDGEIRTKTSTTEKPRRRKGKTLFGALKASETTNG